MPYQVMEDNREQLPTTVAPSLPHNREQTPVSTVASESAFSTGGRVLDVYRSSLNPSMAEALICLQNWMKPSISLSNEINLHEEFEISEKIVSEFGGEALVFGPAPTLSQPML